ncbi:MAG: ParA family protein, partial [Bdellovibrionota bacterium]
TPPHENLHTLDEIYLAKRALDESARKIFIAKTEAGPDLIPSDRALSGVEYYLFTRQDRESVLSRFFSSITHEYDYILIDTPPSLNLLTMNALCASDHVLIPVQPEFFSLEGIVKIREAIDGVCARWNSKLSVIGVLPTQVSHRRKLTGEVIDALRGEIGDTLFENVIHDNAAVAESSGHAQSVLDYDRSSRGAKDYVAAARELERRVREFSVSPIAAVLETAVQPQEASRT